MTPKKEDIIEKVRLWIELAEEDLSVAKHSFTIYTNIPYRLIGFHSQQCAEKYIKAFLVYHSIDFPYTHEIEKLLSLVPEKYGINKILHNTNKLSDYAVSKRYPDFYTKLTRTEAEEAVFLAEAVKKEINALFNKEDLTF